MKLQTIVQAEGRVSHIELTYEEQYNKKGELTGMKEGRPLVYAQFGDVKLQVPYHLSDNPDGIVEIGQPIMVAFTVAVPDDDDNAEPTEAVEGDASEA